MCFSSLFIFFFDWSKPSNFAIDIDNVATTLQQENEKRIIFNICLSCRHMVKLIILHGSRR